MSIQTIIANFKELLKNNYYPIDTEKDKFLEWLELHFNYTNGTVNLKEDKIITEEEYSACDGDEERLKELVDSWARNKPVKQELWYDLIDKYYAYANGVVYINPDNITIVRQTLTATASYIAHVSQKYVYSVAITISPVLKNQRILINGEDKGTTTNSQTWGCSFNFDEKYTGDFIVRIVPMFSNNNLYTGATVIVKAPE